MMIESCVVGVPSCDDTGHDVSGGAWAPIIAIAFVVLIAVIAWKAGSTKKRR